MLVWLLMVRVQGGASARSAAVAGAGEPTEPSPDLKTSTFGDIYNKNRRHIWASAAFLAALVAALGIYGDIGGVAGTAGRRASALAIGWGRVLVPPALGALGALLARGRLNAQPPDDRPRTVQATGAALVVVSLAGLLHLTTGRPTWGARVGEFEDAGGYVGYAAGGALSHLAGAGGATVILLTFGVLGWLAITDRTLRSAATVVWVRARRGAHAVTAAAQQATSTLRVLAHENFPTSARHRGVDMGAPLGARLLAAPPAAAPSSGRTPTGAPTPNSARPVAAEQAPRPRTPAQDEAARKRSSGDWRLPALGLLARSPTQRTDRRPIEEGGRVLLRALAAHGVHASLSDMTVGPTVTRYELVLAAGVKVAQVTSLSRDIAYAMASPEVRILAPIPGRQAIGVEVPNLQRRTVTLGDILSSPAATAATHTLDVGMGRDIAGQPVIANLGDMPHLLIAGATGAGKSSCINSIVTSLLMRSTPEQVRLILIDPKMVEMRQYANVPHLLTAPVTDPKKAAAALAWAVAEMERRYETLSHIGCRDITGYNHACAAAAADAATGASAPRRLPFIVVIVDELSDLMMVAAREVEGAIWRIAQMARAVGVHLVIATQRPSTNVITGVIKANIPTRLALSVSSLTDSRVILDQAGAERLVGHGDMLLVDSTASTPRRIQGAWVSEEEIRRVTAAWRQQNDRPDPPGGITPEDLATAPAADARRNNGDDDLLVAATQLVVDSQLGSTSMLQRKLRIGFARAGRLMDLLEQRGIVGPSAGSKPREVMVSPQEFASPPSGPPSVP